MRMLTRLIALAALIFPVCLPVLVAQEGTEVYEIIDLRRPDEASPFFLDRELARYYTTPEGQAELQMRTVARYPSTKSPDSANAYLGKFFGTMFSSVRLGPPDASKMSSLKVEPENFKLAERGEIEVTYRINNTTSRFMKLEFPTSQRFDVVIKDGSGKVLERWSDDRAFEAQDGVVALNPKEFIEYSTRMPTREMQAGNSYFVEATLANHPEFDQTLQIIPR